MRAKVTTFLVVGLAAFVAPAMEVAAVDRFFIGATAFTDCSGASPCPYQTGNCKQGEPGSCITMATNGEKVYYNASYVELGDTGVGCGLTAQPPCKREVYVRAAGDPDTNVVCHFEFRWNEGGANFVKILAPAATNPCATVAWTTYDMGYVDSCAGTRPFYLKHITGTNLRTMAHWIEFSDPPVRDVNVGNC